MKLMPARVLLILIVVSTLVSCSLVQDFVPYKKFKIDQEIEKGIAALNQDRYEDAELAFNSALLQCQQIEPQGPRTARIYYYLALNSFLRMKFDESRRMLDQALAVGDPTLSKQYPSMTFMLDRHGKDYLARKRYDEAEKALSRSLRIKERHFGKKDVEVAYTLNSLGVLYYHVRRYDLAEKHLKRSLKIKRKHFTKKNTSIATTMNNLGMVMCVKPDYDDALEYLEPAHKTRRINLGPHHKKTVDTAINIGAVYFARGEHRKAEQYLRTALSGRSNGKAPQSLGVLYRARAEEAFGKGDGQTAKLCLAAGAEYFRMARDVAPDPITHADLASTLVELARHEPDKKKRAELRDQAAIEYGKAADLDPSAFNALVKRAVLLAEAKKYQQAEQAIDKALAIKPGEPMLHHFKGFYLERQGRYQESLAAYDQCLALDKNEEACKAGKRKVKKLIKKEKKKR